ncbi:MAG: hypothetical protein KBS79_03760 [Lachnospiraceae bacterium]|nr:hypothetical protein [Candidatus Minthocola equi]
MKKVFIIVPIALILGVAILAGVLMLIPVEHVTVSGSSYYYPEEIEAAVFTDEFSRTAFMTYVRSKIGTDATLPFIDHFDITMTGLKDAHIHAEPKDVKGYVSAYGSNIYFNRKGIVTEISQEVYPGVPLVSGVALQTVALGAELPIESKSIFNELTEISQFISSTKVDMGEGEVTLIEETSHIYFDESENIYCTIGTITVRLGIGYNLEGKLEEMAGILPSLAGRTGTLHLEGYDPQDSNHVYLFD